jgi:hypothetical protein
MERTHTTRATKAKKKVLIRDCGSAEGRKSTPRVVAINCLRRSASLALRGLSQRDSMRRTARGRRKPGSRSKIRKRRLPLGHRMALFDRLVYPVGAKGLTWRLTVMRLPLFGIASVAIGILILAPAEVSAKKTGSAQASGKVKEPAKIEQPNLASTTPKKKGTKGQTEYMTIKMDNPTVTSRQVNPNQPKRPYRPGRPTFGN